MFDFKKTPFRYVFSIAVNVFLLDCMGKGDCVKDGCSQKLQYKHCNGRKQTEGERGRVKDLEFSGVK